MHNILLIGFKQKTDKEMIKDLMKQIKLNENTTPIPGSNNFSKKQLRKKQLEQRRMNTMYTNLQKMFSVLPENL